MSADTVNNPIKLLVTIVNRGTGETVTDIIGGTCLNLSWLFFGKGTASSEILDLLGLYTSEKDMVLSLLPKSQMLSTLARLIDRLKFNRPGKGIAFSLPLSGINGLCAHILTQNEEDIDMADETRNDAPKYNLIITVVRPGFTDMVMDAAKSAGATGGTIIHARGLGKEDAEKYMGISLQDEKEVVAILSPRENHQGIMEAINSQYGLASKAKGIVFSLPVMNIVGLG